MISIAQHLLKRIEETHNSEFAGLYDGVDVLDKLQVNGRLLDEEQIDSGRWHEYVEEVYALEDTSLIAFRFERGLTENQEGDGFYSAQQVVPEEVKKVAYRAIGSEVIL